MRELGTLEHVDKADSKDCFHHFDLAGTAGHPFDFEVGQATRSLAKTSLEHLLLFCEKVAIQ